jgi:hypothetical protein
MVTRTKQVVRRHKKKNGAKYGLLNIQDQNSLSLENLDIFGLEDVRA